MKYTLFSLGYRCTSAGILKHLNIKNESYPFDWLISRLPIIKDCIETDFQHFLNKENYEKKETQTIHYSAINQPFLICNENILFNNYYQEKFNNNELMIPEPLKTPIDTYAYYLATNHRNILYETDYDYFQRCIERFKVLINNPNPKMYLHIHPVISIEEYKTQKEKLLNQFLSFQNYMASLNKETIITGIFFIIVRTNYDYPITNHISEIIESIYYNLPNENNINDINDVYLKEKCAIYILYTHKDFIDAGEIFMQDNNELETSTLIKVIKSFI